MASIEHKSIAFFLNNTHINSNFLDITKANPGIGGTEYMIVLIATLLAESGRSVTIMCTKDAVFYNRIKMVVVNSIKEAVISADDQKIDFFCFAQNYNIELSSFKYIQNGMKIIPWCHLLTPVKTLRAYSRMNCLHRIVFVSKSQLDLYKDFKFYQRCTYIFNSVQMDISIKYHVAEHPNNLREHIVTYVGCLIPTKGFHWLAQSWKEILKEIPDAQLYVIGAGNLYQKDTELGPMKLADANYEKLLWEFLSEKGKLLQSVHFMGILGEEKNSILLKTKVGIPNPSGASETFGISAVEMQAMGAKVATIDCTGYHDTVINGILYKKKKELTSAVVSLLKNEEDDFNSTKKVLIDKFGFDSVRKQWINLLDSSEDKYFNSFRYNPIHKIYLDYIKYAILSLIRKITKRNIKPSYLRREECMLTFNQVFSYKRPKIFQFIFP